MLLSITASLGAALEVIESSTGMIQISELQRNAVYQTSRTELESLDIEILTLVTRLGSLPPDYTTAASKLTATISERRASRTALQESLDNLSELYLTSQIKSIFVLLGRFIHKPPESVMFIILLIMAVSLEVGGILLLTPIQINQKKALNEVSKDITSESMPLLKNVDSRDSHARPIERENGIEPKDFLEAAMDGAKLPYIHGRDVTAKLLGISYGEAKRIVKDLIKTGRIKVKGKRLVLSEQ
jgi:hypothetical protein